MRVTKLCSLVKVSDVMGAGALVLTACGGSGLDDDEDNGSAQGTNGGEGGELTSSDDALELLIGSSGEAETAAVEDAVAAWAADSGIDASVSVANDLPQQLSDR